MSELEQTLKKEIGGVPVWGIATGVGALVIGGAYFWNARGGGSTQTVYSPDDMQPEEGDPTNSDIGLPEGPIGDWFRDNPGHPAYPVGTGNGLPAPITNEQWGRFVSDQLLGDGKDPSIVTSAIRKFLDKVALTEAEAAIIRLAQQQYGSPPEGVLSIITGGTTPTTPPVTESRPVTINVAKGFQWNTMVEYLRKQYPQYGPYDFAKLYALNPTFVPFNVRNGVVTRASKLRIK